MSRKLKRQAMQRRKHHKDFHLVIRASAPSQEAEKFAKQLMKVITMIRRKHFPDTTIHDYKLGHVV
ncbi:MAG: hypothetical protein PVI03_01440 [Candidatus Thorarchaeota archaeon]|jgi:hypothetical protein